ncbi:MAG: PLxRFG domain-containing protein, partial [Candidatus Thorarchaeota archaeon]
SDEEATLIETMKRKGYDAPQRTRDTMGEMQGAFGRTWGKLMNASMWLFGKTEMWNRGTTLLAAYRMARKQGQNIKQATESAKTATGRAHGLYGKATLPAWAQGTNPVAKIGQLTYVYAKFGHNWVQMAYDLGLKKKDIKSFLWTMITPLVLGGSASLIMKSAIWGVVGAIMSAIGDDRDPEKVAMDKVREHLGRTAELGVRYGVVGLAGGDISGSMAVDPGIPKDMLELAGAIGGIVGDIGTGLHFLKTGQQLRAAEVFLPVGLGNMLRAVRELEGVTTRKGRMLFDEENRPYKPTTKESLLRGAGFRSSRVATVQQRRWELKKEQKSFAARRAAIYERYRAYQVRPTAREFRKIARMIREYNKSIIDAGRQGEIPPIKTGSVKQQAKGMVSPGRKGRLLDYQR